MSTFFKSFSFWAGIAGILLFVLGFLTATVIKSDDEDDTTKTTPTPAISATASPGSSNEQLKAEILKEVDAKIASSQGATKLHLEELKATITKANADAVASLKDYWMKQVNATAAATPQGSSTPSGSSPATGPFPKSAAEAAAMFGGDASRWEATADPGGWHMREEPFTTLLQPSGFLLEGYNDTEPGKNPDCYVSTAPINVQGATVWNEPGTRDNAVKLQAKMAIPKWDDGQLHPCRVLAP